MYKMSNPICCRDTFSSWKPSCYWIKLTEIYLFQPSLSSTHLAAHRKAYRTWLFPPLDRKKLTFNIIPPPAVPLYKIQRLVNDIINMHKLIWHSSHKPLAILVAKGCSEPPLCERKKKFHAAWCCGPRRHGFCDLQAKSNGVLLPPARLSLFINAQPAPTHSLQHWY